jgi:hypothetical protein
VRVNQKVPHCKTSRDPEPPFQGSGTTLSRNRGAMPRAVVGRPVGAEEARTGRRRHPLPPLHVPWFLAATPLCASARDRLPFGQQMGREVLAQRRWGAEGDKRVIGAFFAAWPLGGFAPPVCP